MVRALLLHTGTNAKADPTLRDRIGHNALGFGSSVFPSKSLRAKDEECEKLLEGPTREWGTGNDEHSLLDIRGIPLIVQYR